MLFSPLTLYRSRDNGGFYYSLEISLKFKNIKHSFSITYRRILSLMLCLRRKSCLSFFRPSRYRNQVERHGKAAAEMGLESGGLTNQFRAL